MKFDWFQVTKADVHQSGYQNQNQSDVLSSTSDWEVTSVDRWTSQHPIAKSATASMNNFLDVQSIQSNPTERSSDTDARVHLSDTDSRTDKLGSDTDSVSLKGDNKSENLDESKELIDFESTLKSADVTQDEVFVKDDNQAIAAVGKDDHHKEKEKDKTKEETHTDHTDKVGNVLC